MNDLEFHDIQTAQAKAFAKQLQDIASRPGGETLTELAEQYAALAADPASLLEEGPALVFRMLTVAPQTAEIFPRDLLWYMGGECLHFMPDDEIALYVALDEARRQADALHQPFDWIAARARALGLQ